MTESTLSARSWAKSDQGKVRELNEDYSLIVEPPAGDPRRQKGYLYVVADGMGGHQAGEVASKVAADALEQAYYQDLSEPLEAGLRRAFAAANAKVYEMGGGQDPQGMGTTLVAAVLKGQTLTVAHVGDSRAYLLHNRRLTRLTQDHSWVEAQVQAGVLTPEQAQAHPQRGVITRAVGARPEVEADVRSVIVQEGDRILLCTDGLHGELSDYDIGTLLQDDGTPQLLAEGLVRAASEHGGNDNITALVVQVGLPVTPKASRRRGATASGLPVLVVAAVLLVLCLAAVVVGGPALRDRLMPAAPAPTASPIVVRPTATPLPTFTPASALQTPGTSVTPTAVLAQPTKPAPSATPTPRVAEVTVSDGARLRSEPSTKGTIVAVAAKGTRLTIIGEARGESFQDPSGKSSDLWYQVLREDGKPAYVRSDLVLMK